MAEGWHWPQYVMATVFYEVVLAAVFKKENSKTDAVLVIAIVAFVIYVLHCGGFW